MWLRSFYENSPLNVTQWNKKFLWPSLSSLEAFVFTVLLKTTSFEISFIYCTINPFKVYSLINFNIFRVVQLIYNQFWDIFITLRRNPVAISNEFALYAWMLVSRFHKTDNFLTSLKWNITISRKATLPLLLFPDFLWMTVFVAYSNSLSPPFILFNRTSILFRYQVAISYRGSQSHPHPKTQSTTNLSQRWCLISLDWFSHGKCYNTRVPLGILLAIYFVLLEREMWGRWGKVHFPYLQTP